MKEYSEMFFESYSLSVEAAYDAYFKIAEGNFSQGFEKNNAKLHSYLCNEYRKWINTPLEMLGDKTPVEFLDSVNSLTQLTCMFIYGAAACDEDLPEIFLDKLKSYGEDAVDILLGIAGREVSDDSEESFLAPLMAIKVLGYWKVQKAVNQMIHILDSREDIFELVFETARDALVNIGTPALDEILTALDSEHLSQTAADYLVMALSEIGKSNPSDRIYLRLKKAFIDAPQKIIAASSLGNYGDGRAVAVLRGYLEKRGTQLDKETFYEIISAIKLLGGRTDDLK